MKRNVSVLKPHVTKKISPKLFSRSIIDLVNSTGTQNLTMFLNVDAAAVGNGKHYLVFAPIDATGHIDLDNTVSLELPCPPYCDRQQVTVMTPDAGPQA